MPRTSRIVVISLDADVQFVRTGSQVTYRQVRDALVDLGADQHEIAALDSRVETFHRSGSGRLPEFLTPVSVIQSQESDLIRIGVGVMEPDLVAVRPFVASIATDAFDRGDLTFNSGRLLATPCAAVCSIVELGVEGGDVGRDPEIIFATSEEGSDDEDRELLPLVDRQLQADALESGDAVDAFVLATRLVPSDLVGKVSQRERGSLAIVFSPNAIELVFGAAFEFKSRLPKYNRMSLGRALKQLSRSEDDSPLAAQLVQMVGDPTRQLSSASRLGLIPQREAWGRHRSAAAERTPQSPATQPTVDVGSKATEAAVVQAPTTAPGRSYVAATRSRRGVPRGAKPVPGATSFLERRGTAPRVQVSGLFGESTVALENIGPVRWEQVLENISPLLPARVITAFAAAYAKDRDRDGDIPKLALAGWHLIGEHEALSHGIEVSGRGRLLALECALVPARVSRALRVTPSGSKAAWTRACERALLPPFHGLRLVDVLVNKQMNLVVENRGGNMTSPISRSLELDDLPEPGSILRCMDLLEEQWAAFPLTTRSTELATHAMAVADEFGHMRLEITRLVAIDGPAPRRPDRTSGVVELGSDELWELSEDRKFEPSTAFVLSRLAGTSQTVTNADAFLGGPSRVAWSEPEWAWVGRDRAKFDSVERLEARSRSLAPTISPATSQAAVEPNRPNRSTTVATTGHPPSERERKSRRHRTPSGPFVLPRCIPQYEWGEFIGLHTKAEELYRSLVEQRKSWKDAFLGEY